MRYLAIDYGAKRLGLAICDADQVIVSPLGRLELKKGQVQKLLHQLTHLATEHQVGAFVVGLPLNMDGSEGSQALTTRRFARQLQNVTDLPVHFQDERLSSAAADEMLADIRSTPRRRRQHRDMLAACDILRQFLDAKH